MFWETGARCGTPKCVPSGAAEEREGAGLESVSGLRETGQKLLQASPWRGLWVWKSLKIAPQNNDFGFWLWRYTPWLNFYHPLQHWSGILQSWKWVKEFYCMPQKGIFTPGCKIRAWNQTEAGLTVELSSSWDHIEWHLIRSGFSDVWTLMFLFYSIWYFMFFRKRSLGKLGFSKSVQGISNFNYLNMFEWLHFMNPVQKSHFPLWMIRISTAYQGSHWLQ